MFNIYLYVPHINNKTYINSNTNYFSVSVAKPPHLKTTNNFIGCMRMIVVKGVKIEIEDSVEVKGIIPNSCPSNANNV